MDNVFKNAEGYPDPTAGEALTKIMKEMRAHMPVVYICSKFSGDIKRNVEKAKRYCRFALEEGVIPFAPHLLFPQFMDEDTERDLAIIMGIVLLYKCDELWVFGQFFSRGMRCEIEKARKHNMKIRFYSENCKERK